MIRFIDEEGIIEPVNAVGKVADIVKQYGAKAAVTSFSNHLFREILSRYGGKKLAAVTGGIDNDIYGIEYDGKKLIAYQSPVGAPAAVMATEEALCCGVESVVAFGICGALSSVPERTFVVPTSAYRDEGTSGHYAAQSDYIELKGASRLAAALSRYGLKTVSGPDWCTDAMYRETRTRISEMKAFGCISVDMECAALQAACSYRKKNFYTFFITADSLAGEEWEPNYILDISLEPLDSVGVAAAVRFASEL